MAASLAGGALAWLEKPVWLPEDVHGMASVRPANGKLAVPGGPGLGCDPDPAGLARYTVGTPTRISMREGA